MARRGEAAAAVAAFTYALSLVNLVPNEGWLEEPKATIDPAQIEALIAARNAARQARDFALADRLRDTLAAEKILLHDTRDGTTWSVAD
ncbi:MAG: hypothetical protein JOY59_04965 [Candidatus Eremiobacteraeota bacterium]|nr:hypothetical protein [Candidatus Eremiobacteraeota bacterium]